MAHILVVDDESSIREILRLLLEDEGHQVLEAGDGQEALDCLHVSHARLVVLLDVNMPKLDGLAVLRTVALSPRLATRHVYVLVTANSERVFSTSIASLLTQLCIPMVHKPFDIELITRTVASAARRLEAAKA